MKRHNLIAGAIAAFLIAGCATATFRSTKMDLANPPPDVPVNKLQDYGTHEGTAYFLPNGFIHLVAILQNPAGNTAPGSNVASGAQGAASPYYQVTIDTVILPDGANMFLLRPRLSAWAHDNFGITVQNGLLTSIGSSNADQSGTVLLKLAELAGTISAALKAAPGANAPTKLPSRIELMFSPDNLAMRTNASAGGH